MITQNPLSDEGIINCLNAHYGIEIISLKLMPLGADMNACVFKAEANDRSSYFIKLKRGHYHNIGLAILELLHNAGIQQIIPPIKTIHGQSNQHIDHFTLIAYPFIEGENGFSRTLSREQWQILGKTLRQVHEIDVPWSLQSLIRREGYSPKWRETVRSLYKLTEVPVDNDEIAQKLFAFMKKNAKIIHRMVDRAEQLAQKLQAESLKFVLCHSDIHGGNILMDRDNNIYIVDWDEPIMAPKERDLMFIAGGVGNVWNKPREAAEFYQGYGETEVNREILAYYRHERIVEDIAQYGQDLLLDRAENNDRSLMYQHFIAMFESNGVVDIAFKTS